MSKYMSLEQTIRKLGTKGVSQPLEKDMNDQVHAGSYSSKHFEVSAPAQKLYASLPKDVDPDKAERSVQLHDKLFAIHKKTTASERSTTVDQEAAQKLHDEIMALAKEMGLEDKHGHVKDSLEHIKKYVDTQTNVKDDIKPEDVAKRYGTPPKDYQNDVKADADIDNLARFKITRDKKGQRKLKIIDDEFNLGAEHMDRIEKVSASFLEALKQVKSNAEALEEKKKMTKADIAALKEPKGSIDANDLAALRAGEHKKKVKEEVEQIDEMEHEDDDGWYAHKEMHGSKAVSKEDWKKGYRLNSKGEKVKKVKEEVEQVDENASEKSLTKKQKARLNAAVFKASPQNPVNIEKKKRAAEKEKTEFYNSMKRPSTNEEVEQVDEAQFIVIQKGMTKKRVRNNPDQIAKARREGWAIQEETVEEGSEMKNLVKSQKAAVVKRELQQRKQMFAKKDATDKAKHAKALQKEELEQIDEISDKLRKNYINKAGSQMVKASKASGKVTGGDTMAADSAQNDKSHPEYKAQKRLAGIHKAADTLKGPNKKLGAAIKTHADDASFNAYDSGSGGSAAKKLKSTTSKIKEEFMERAIAILGESFKDATYDELVEEIVKKARGRPRKNPLPDPNAPKRARGRPRKDAESSSSAAKSEDSDKDREHIVSALRKSISLRGEHGVKFADGSTHKISAEHAHKALKMHDSLNKPSEKMAFQRKLGASHSSFKNALDDKNPGSEEKKKTSGITLAKKAEL